MALRMVAGRPEPAVPGLPGLCPAGRCGVSPEDGGEFGRYAEYRQSEDEVCTRLRMRLSDTAAAQYEEDLRKLRAGSKTS